MARDTDVGPVDATIGRARTGRCRRQLIAGGRMQDDWYHFIARMQSDNDYLAQHLRRLKDLTNDPEVVEALRVAHQRREQGP